MQRVFVISALLFLSRLPLFYSDPNILNLNTNEVEANKETILEIISSENAAEISNIDDLANEPDSLLVDSTTTFEPFILNLESISSFNESNDEIINFNADSSKRHGLINHKFICYMSSVVTSLYGIDIFRRALYSATSLNASSVMLSQVFAKIQMASAPVHTQFCLIPAFEADLEWKFGQFECILDFGTKLLDSLPESVTNLFKLNVRCSQITKSDDKSLKFEDNFESHLIISPRFGSVSAAIYSRFLDSQADNFVITKDDWKYYSEIIPEFEEEKIYVPMYTEMNILNRPEILIFGIRRLTTYPSIDFDISEMILDFEFDMPSEDNEALPVKYFLQAFCYHAPGHYISYVRDFKSETIGGDWYMYNDLKVTSVRTKGDYAKLRRLADTSATLAFYVRADSIVKNEDGVVTEEIQIPERIATIANLMISLENTEEKKLKMESAKALSLTNLAKPIFSSKKRSNFLPVTSNSSSYVSPFSIFKDDVMKCTSSLLEFTKWFPLNSNYSDENI